jgi:NADPH:quinone reductase-like Zn-dependent oxidoreductase
MIIVQPSAEQLKEVGRLIDEGKLRAHVETILPLSQIKKAHELSKVGHTRGKIVLRVADQS